MVAVLRKGESPSGPWRAPQERSNPVRTGALLVFAVVSGLLAGVLTAARSGVEQEGRAISAAADAEARKVDDLRNSLEAQAKSLNEAQLKLDGAKERRRLAEQRKAEATAELERGKAKVP
jgi:hypothetical protein